MNQENDRQLPDGWQWVKLGYIAEVATGGTPNTNHPEYGSSGFRVLIFVMN